MRETVRMAGGFLDWCAGSATRWTVVLALPMAAAVALFAADLSVEAASPVQAAACMLLLGGIVAVYRRDQRSPRISAAAEALLLLMLINLSGMLLSYAAATIGMPYQDAALHAVDRFIGFDWYAYAALIDSSALLTLACKIAYLTLIPQSFLLVVVLTVAGRYEQMNRFLIAVTLAMLVTCAVFALMPAVSVYAFLDVPVGSFEHIMPVSTYQHVGPIEALRSER